MAHYGSTWIGTRPLAGVSDLRKHCEAPWEAQNIGGAIAANIHQLPTLNTWNPLEPLIPCPVLPIPHPCHQPTFTGRHTGVCWQPTRTATISGSDSNLDVPPETSLPQQKALWLTQIPLPQDEAGSLECVVCVSSVEGTCVWSEAVMEDGWMLS